MRRALIHAIWLRLLLIATILCSSAFLPARPGHAAFPIAAADPAAVPAAPADAIPVTIGAGGFSLATLAMTLGQAITWRNETTSPQVVQIQTPTSLPDDDEPTLPNKTFLPTIHQSVATAAHSTAATHPLDTAGEVTLQPGQEVSYTVTKLGEYRFQLRDQTAAMAATVTAPDHLVLFHIGNQVAPLGSTLTIDLMAYDPEGATLRFGIAPLPLPARMNMDLGRARFTFRPTVDQVGSYPLTFTVTAGQETATETVQITVPTVDPTGAGGTALRGRILDANRAAADAIVPLVGATVRLVNKPTVSATTDSAGYFELTGVDGGEQYVEFDGSTATPAGKYGAYRSKQVLIANVANVIDRPIYIMAIDMTGQTMLDPDSTTTVNNPNVNTTIVIPPQTVRNDAGDLYSGPISISEVPADFTPSSLPGTLDPGMVLTIQPMGLTFAQPAPITLPNLDNLPAGSAVDIWSMDHETAQFFIAGKGVVSADGTQIETVEGGIRESSWHFPMPPVANPTIPPDGTPDNIGNGCQTEVSSTVDIAGGCLRTAATLPTYTSLGQDWGIELIYSSERAYPQPLFPIHFAISGRAAVPPRLSYGLTNFGGTAPSGTIYLDTSQLSETQDEPVRGVAAVDGTALATGVYPYAMRVTSHYARSNVSADLTGYKIVLNERDSALGSGWGLAGLQRLYPQEDGTVLLTNGDGSALRFKSNIAPRIGGFDAARGGEWSFPNGSKFSNARDSVNRNYPENSLVALNTLTPDVVADTNILILSSVAAGSGRVITPLSAAEQQTLIEYVRAGKCAFLLLDHYQLADPMTSAAHESLIDAFGMDGSGFIRNDNLRVPINDPTHPLANGPFGRVTEIVQNWTGGIINLGPYAISLATNAIGASIAVIDPGKIAEGAGGVVVHSDGNAFAGGILEFGFRQNERAFLNTISFCLSSRLAAAGEFYGPAGDFSTITKAEDSTYTRRLKDGTTYTFTAAGYQTAMIDRNGNRTTYVYDEANRLVRITDPTGQTTTLSYANGKLSMITDPQQRTTTFTHDGTGNLTQVTFPDGSTQRFGYDSRHLMTSEIDRRGSRARGSTTSGDDWSAHSYPRQSNATYSQFPGPA